MTYEEVFDFIPINHRIICSSENEWKIKDKKTLYYISKVNKYIFSMDVEKEEIEDVLMINSDHKIDTLSNQDLIRIIMNHDLV